MSVIYTIQRISFYTVIMSLLLGSLFLSTPSVMAAGNNVPKLLKDLKTSLPSHIDLPKHCFRDCVRQVAINTDVLKQNQVSISLFEQKSIVANCQYRASGHDQTQCWIGEVEGYPGSTVAITKHKGAIAGNISYGDELFQINQLPNGTNVIFKVDKSSLPAGCSSIPVDAKELEAEANNIENASNTSNPGTPKMKAALAQNEFQFDIMLLYTPASRKRYGKASLEAKIINAVESANQAYRNSLIPTKLKVVHMAEVNYSESGMEKTLDHLQGNADGHMDQIHAWRDKHGADLVSMVTEDAGFCGIGFSMTNPSKYFASFAFSVVNSDCLSNQTLAHEIGHNQGNVHDHDNSNRAGAYPYSHGHRRCTNDNKGFKTIMSYPCGRTQYINYFSNPKVSYNGFPTGIANSSDCARSMTNTAEIVASFRDSVSQSSISVPSNLTATVSSASSIQLKWRDNSNVETTFKIERKMGSTSWRQISTVGANITTFKDTGLTPETAYSYRIRAANSTGNSAYSNVATAKTFKDGIGDAPKAPSNLTAIALSAFSIQLKWKDNSNNESAFQVERNMGAQSWKVINTVGANVASFRDNNLTSATIYRYRVRAKNSNGNSAYSNVIYASTPGNLQSGPPKPPSHLTATPLSSSSIQIKWKDNSNNESSFKIERKMGSQGWKQIRIAKPNEITFKDTGLKPGTTCSYRVRAANIRGNSAYSNQATAKTLKSNIVKPTASLKPPSNLTAKVLSSSSIQIQWKDNSIGESMVKIERKIGSGSWKQIATVGANGTNFKNTGLSANTEYRYRVRASYGSKNSDFSNVVTVKTPGKSTGIAPKAPSNLTATPLSPSSIQLKWKDNANNESSFMIERKMGSQGWNLIATVGANVTHFRNNGLVPATLYQYRVRSKNNKGNSTYSNVISARTLTKLVAGAPKPPSNLTATAVSSSSIQLKWKDNSNNEKIFKIERKVGSEIWKLINLATPNVTSFRDTQLQTGITYRYRLRAANSSGNSAYSNVVTTTMSTQNNVSANALENQDNDLLASKISSAIFNSKKPVSFTVYEDGEDESVAGWHQYKKGNVKNIQGGANGSERAIEISGEITNDVFRLGKNNGSDWNNEKEFFLEFSLAMNKPRSGAVYIQLDTSIGIKYIVYTDVEVKNENPYLTYVSLGDFADGEWHTAFRSLDEDLHLGFPEAQLKSVKAMFVFGSLKIDNVELLKFE